MKVLAKNSEGYLCQVSHTEIEKHLDKYYGNLKALREGEEIDLGCGYDWHSKIQSALKTIQEHTKAHKAVFDALQAGLFTLAGDDND